MSVFNEKLRTLLANREWTQAQLAAVMHVSPSAVQKWVVGKNMPDAETVKLLMGLCQPIVPIFAPTTSTGEDLKANLRKVLMRSPVDSLLRASRLVAGLLLPCFSSYIRI